MQLPLPYIHHAVTLQLPRSCHAITILLSGRYHAVIVKSQAMVPQQTWTSAEVNIHCRNGTGCAAQLSCKHMTSLQAAWHHPEVVVLRDKDTIEALVRRLPGMRRVVLVGNGGIALEVAHSLTSVEVFLDACQSKTHNEPAPSELFFRLLLQQLYRRQTNAQMSSCAASL